MNDMPMNRGTLREPARDSGAAAVAVSRTTKSALVFALVLAANLYLLATADPQVSVPRRVAGSLCLWTVFPPLVAFIYARSYTLLYSPVVVVLYGIYFSRNVFTPNHFIGGVPFAESQLIDSSWVLLPGLVGISAAFTLGQLPNFSRLLPRIEWTPNLDHARTRLTVVACIEPLIRLSLTLRLLPESVQHGVMLIQYLTQCAGLAVLCDRFANPDRRSWHAWVILAALLLSAAVGVGGSLVAVPIMIFAVPIFAYVGIRRRLPVVAVVAFLAAMAPLLYVRGEYRKLPDWNIYDTGSSERFLRFAYENIESRGFDAQHLADSSQERLNMFGALTQVVVKSPDEVPLWNGETYLPAFTVFIPRALWPEKTVLDTGQQFGHRFGFLDETDYLTSANMPLLVEVRANFDDEWMLLGMFLIGCIELFIWRLFDHAKSSPVLLAMGATVLANLCVIESCFSLSIAPAIIEIPIILFGMWALIGADSSALPRIVRM